MQNEETSAPSGSTRSGPDELEGKIPAEELQNFFREYSAATRECYERQLKKNPSLQGRVMLRLTIGSDGSVAEADVQGETLRDDQVNACIENRVRGWKFPEPSGGAAEVTKPFTFRPKDN
jgi:TonB family protein